MQPFERLRSIARHGGDDRSLVADAADCLADFDDDPAALVVTCRQLLHHHPESGPLWWLCSKVLAAPEPSEAAWEAEALIRDDRTPGRLAALLPFPHDDPIVVLGWPELTGLGLESRPDLDVLAVRSNTGDDRWRNRLARSDASARPVDLVDAASREPSHVLVEVVAASPTQMLVPDGTTVLLEALARPTMLAWFVAGVGRVLPARLFETMVRGIGDPLAYDLELVDVQVADRIAGPTGLVRPENMQRRVDCPVAPELLRQT
jgi:hypothetical protein